MDDDAENTAEFERDEELSAALVMGAISIALWAFTLIVIIVKYVLHIWWGYAKKQSTYGCGLAHTRKWKETSWQWQCEDDWQDYGGVLMIQLRLFVLSICVELEEQVWLKDLQGDSFRLYGYRLLSSCL